MAQLKWSNQILNFRLLLLVKNGFQPLCHYITLRKAISSPLKNAGKLFFFWEGILASSAMSVLGG